MDHIFLFGGVLCRRVYAQSISIKQAIYCTPHEDSTCVCTSCGRDNVGNAAAFGSVCVCQAPSEMLLAQHWCISRLSCVNYAAVVHLHLLYRRQAPLYLQEEEQ